MARRYPDAAGELGARRQWSPVRPCWEPVRSEVIALRGAVAVAVDDSPFAVLPAKDVGGAQRVPRPNRNCSPRSPRSIRRLRACWLTQAPVG